MYERVKQNYQRKVGNHLKDLKGRFN